MTRKFVSVLSLVLALFIGSAAFASTPKKPDVKGQTSAGMTNKSGKKNHRSRRRHQQPKRHHGGKHHKSNVNKTPGKTSNRK